MQVKIISGVSGAGKSTFLQTQPWIDNAVIHSADSFFFKDGKYQFDASLLGEAHGACMRDFIQSVRGSWRAVQVKELDYLPTVEVVDNTNLTIEEIAPYYSVARAYGFEVELITLHCPPQVAFARNAHGVSMRTIERMAERLGERALPIFWELKQTHYVWNGVWTPVET